MSGVVTLATPLVALLAAAGGISFRTVVQAAPPGSGPAGARVYLAAQPSELAAFTRFLAPADRPGVRSLGFGARVAVAVFRGPAPTGGHTITVRRLSVAKGRLRVVASVRAPAPGEPVTQARTSPYHVVSAARTAFGARLPSSWTLLDSAGRVLGAGTFPARRL